MRCGTWSVRSQYRSGSLTRVARELARYNVIYRRFGGTKQALQQPGILYQTMKKETKIINWE